LTKETGSWTAL